MMSQRRYRIVDETVRAAAVDSVQALMPPHGSLSMTAAARAVAKDLGVHPNSVIAWFKSVLDLTGATPAQLSSQLAQARLELEASRRINRDLMAQLRDTGKAR